MTFMHQSHASNPPRWSAEAVYAHIKRFEHAPRSEEPQVLRNLNGLLELVMRTTLTPQGVRRRSELQVGGSKYKFGRWESPEVVSRDVLPGDHTRRHAHMTVGPPKSGGMGGDYWLGLVTLHTHQEGASELTRAGLAELEEARIGSSYCVRQPGKVADYFGVQKIIDSDDPYATTELWLADETEIDSLATLVEAAIRSEITP